MGGELDVCVCGNEMERLGKWEGGSEREREANGTNLSKLSSFSQRHETRENTTQALHALCMASYK